MTWWRRRSGRRHGANHLALSLAAFSAARQVASDRIQQGQRGVRVDLTTSSSSCTPSSASRSRAGVVVGIETFHLVTLRVAELTTGDQVVLKRARSAPNPCSRVARSRQCASSRGIVMDGNGRWAQQRGLARTEGHTAGGGLITGHDLRCAELRGEGPHGLCLLVRKLRRPVTRSVSHEFQSSLLDRRQHQLNAMECASSFRGDATGAFLAAC